MRHDPWGRDPLFLTALVRPVPPRSMSGSAWARGPSTAAAVITTMGGFAAAPPVRPRPPVDPNGLPTSSAQAGRRKNRATASNTFCRFLRRWRERERTLHP
jgi:hypothetical protein